VADEDELAHGDLRRGGAGAYDRTATERERPMTDSDITIRAADAADAERLAVVGQATFLETYATTVDGTDLVAHCVAEHSPARWRALLAEPGVQAWIAELQPTRAPVGYVLLTRPDLPDAAADDLEVRRIYVLQRFQGRHVGVRLLNEAIAAAQAAGAHRLLLGVYAVNDAAVAFYTRCGFRRVGTREFAVGAGRYHDYVLARALD
jgi:ribosomal protein S18 acetylase RimI-like enzyme